jgi:hypothetical protein
LPLSQYGVVIVGNLTLRARYSGLGVLAALDDGLLLQVLDLLPHDCLGRLAATSRVLYCFANHDELWKALVIEVRIKINKAAK